MEVRVSVPTNGTDRLRCASVVRIVDPNTLEVWDIAANTLASAVVANVTPLRVIDNSSTQLSGAWSYVSYNGLNTELKDASRTMPTSVTGAKLIGNANGAPGTAYTVIDRDMMDPA